LSGPSVPKELEAIIPRFKIPIAPIIQKARDPYATFSDYDEEQHVLEVERYSDLQELMGPVLSRVIEAAEKYHAKRRKVLKRASLAQGTALLYDSPRLAQRLRGGPLS
jgi:hypothetical protein